MDPIFLAAPVTFRPDSSRTTTPMHAKFITLLLLSILPWSYVAVIVLTDHAGDMAGFELIPFFGLFFAKEMALKSSADRRDAALKSAPLRELPMVLIISVLLVAVVMIGSELVSRWTEGRTQWIPWLVMGTFALTVISLDLRRAAARSFGDEREKSIAEAA